MKRGLDLKRRDVMLGGLAVGLTTAIGLHAAHAKAVGAVAHPSHALIPAGGEVAQTVALQAALDAAAASGTPLFLPPGTYRTGRLSLKSGTQIQGVPGSTVLIADAPPGGLFEISGTDTVRLSGLVLDGGGIALGEASALLTATETTGLEISDCRFLNSGGNGVSLRKSSGRISHCEFSTIAKTALLSEDGTDVEISDNTVDKAAMGIEITGMNETGGHGFVHGNRIRNLFHRKIGACGGVGIGIEAGCTVTGNVVENAPAYGILVGGGDRLGDVTVTGNVIRKSHIGIGISANAKGKPAHIAGNFIDGTRDGAIRAMNGPRPIGPDLAGASAKTANQLNTRGNISS